jgi:HAD superfamily hydrolase (TIGR01549 family)
MTKQKKTFESRFGFFRIEYAPEGGVLMQVLTGIAAALIDIDDTLLDFDKCAAFSIARAEEKTGLFLPPDAFSTFKRINRELWDRLQAGEYDLDYLRSIRWNTMFEAMGVEGDGVEFEYYFERALEKSAVPVDGAEDLLRRLSAKLPVYAASNAPSGQQEERLRLAGMDGFFAGVFTSGDLGFSKPDPRFFDALLALLPYPPEALVMIGDSVSADVTGAKARGIRTVLFDPHGAFEPADADAYARKLADVPPLLGL